MGRLVCCLFLLLVADANAEELFVAHSRDTPSRLWADLDATVEETQRDGRVSIFKIHTSNPRVGAAGRFFICTMMSLARQRDYVNYLSAKEFGGHIVVIFLKEHDEDFQALIDSGYREYEFHERVGAEEVAGIEELCVIARAEETPATDFYTRGNAYYSKGEYDNAIAEYDQAIRLKPDFADALGNRATAYYLKGQYDQAIADFTQAIRVRPKDALAFNNRGTAYDDRGDHDRVIADYDRAIADYTEAIRLDTLKGPRKAWPFNNRGNTYKAKGQYDRAIADYDQAIRLNPDYTAAIESRGEAKFYLGRFAAAVPDLARAVKSNSKDSYAVIDLYLAQARAGEGGLGDLKTNSGRLDLDEWPGPVISMFLGETDPAAVAATGSASATREEREKRCEATFYVGQYHLLHGDRQKAAEFFRVAVATEITYFMEYKGAKAELARLE